MADPVASKMVHRRRMSGESWVVPSPANEGGCEDCSGGGRGGEVVQDDVGQGRLDAEVSRTGALVCRVR